MRLLATWPYNAGTKQTGSTTFIQAKTRTYIQLVSTNKGAKHFDG